MNIQFQNQVRESSNDNMNRVAGHDKAAGTQAVNSGFKVDISGRDKDIKAFGMEDLMSGADVMSKAAVKDVTLEQNALAVMSNSMSSEDFAKLQKDGFSPDDMNAEETVTCLDKIKAKLVQSGTVIPGYTDDLSSDQIEAITGSAAYAAAVESALRDNQLPVSEENVRTIDDAIDAAGSVTSLSDDAKKYMITNELPVTVNNLYMAGYSYAETNANKANGVVKPEEISSKSNKSVVGQAAFYKDAAGYVGRNATDIDIEELKPQISKIIQESGLELNNDTMNSAQWLIERNVPLTAENLTKLQDLNSLSLPLDADTVAKSSAAAIADGRGVDEAELTNTESLVGKAARIVNEVLDQVDRMETDSEISKHRQLEEVRLHMTVEANLQLLKKGISIDTSDLQKLVEDLKQAEKEYFAPFLMDEDIASVPSDQIQKYDDELSLKIDLFKQTTAAIETIKSAPIDYVGEIVKDAVNSESNTSVRGSENLENKITLADVSRSADALRSTEATGSTDSTRNTDTAKLAADLTKANKSYETMMTAPRRDMGDSIRKAFRNVDDILEDLDIEVTRINEKAVRILGYAGIEINEENISSAAKAEVAVENIIANMTPARTLKMIRNGENPLDTDIYELSDKLIAENNEDEDNSKYAEFLLRLEKSGEITEDEQKAFIGMYRLFRKIEKSDGKLIGDVLKADEMLTFNNIITASRSDRQLGTDIKIDDSFGAIEKIVSYGESITDQILAGFRSSNDVNGQKTSDATNEKTTARTGAAEAGSVEIGAYEKAKLSEIKQAFNVENKILEMLDNLSEPHSPLNMAAAQMLVNNRGSLFRTIKGSIEGTNDLVKEESNDFSEAIDELQDSFEDEESVKTAYERFNEKASEIIKNATENADKYIDVRSLKLASRQLSIVNKMTDSRTYEVPVEIDGELTSISLKLINDSENAGKISLSYATENTGKVKAEFTLRDGNVSGFVVTENSYFAEVFGEKEEAFTEEFKSAGVNVTSMYHTSSRGLSIDGNYVEKSVSDSDKSDESSETNTPETKQLYRVAKAIITAVQK